MCSHANGAILAGCGADASGGAPVSRQKAYCACLALGFVLAFAVRISFNDDLSGMDLTCGNYDGMEYHWLANNLCRGRGLHAFSDGGYDYRMLRPPGYPLYIAAVYCIAGMRFLFLRIADTLFSALSAVLAALIARELAGRKAALIALALAVFYRPAVFFATRIFSENLFCFLMLLSILLLIRRRGTPWACAVAGGLSGCLVLTRPVWLGVLPFVLAWIAASRGRRLVRSACLLLGVAAATAPWAAYCRATLGMPVSSETFSSLRGAYGAWLAYNPAAGDYTQRGPEHGRDLEHEWAQLTFLRFRNWRLPEAEYLAAVSGEASRFFRADPRRCVTLGVKRVYRAWLGSGLLDGQGTILPDTGENPYGIIYWKGRIFDPAVYLGDTEIIEQLPFRRELRILGVHVPLLSFEGVFYLMVLGLLACAMFNARHLPGRGAAAARRYSLLLLIAASYTAANVVAVTIQRFRFPLEYLVIVIAGGAIACALSPFFRFLGATLRVLGIWIDGGPEGTPRGPALRIPPNTALLAGAAVAAALATRCAWSLRGFHESVRAQCAVRVTDADLLSRMGRGPAEAHGAPAYRSVWERQMEGAGDLGGMLGKEILWRGEATWINPPSRADFQGEYYLQRAQARFMPGMKNPGFFRLIVDSYRDPDSIGAGEAIVVASGTALDRLKEGDHVAVLGRLGGTDFVVGSMIVCAEEIRVVDGAGASSGGGRI